MFFCMMSLLAKLTVGECGSSCPRHRCRKSSLNGTGLPHLEWLRGLSIQRTAAHLIRTHYLSVWIPFSSCGGTWLLQWGLPNSTVCNSQSHLLVTEWLDSAAFKAFPRGGEVEDVTWELLKYVHLGGWQDMCKVFTKSWRVCQLSWPGKVGHLSLM